MKFKIIETRQKVKEVSWQNVGKSAATVAKTPFKVAGSIIGGLNTLAKLGKEIGGIFGANFQIVDYVNQKYDAIKNLFTHQQKGTGGGFGSSPVVNSKMKKIADLDRSAFMIGGASLSSVNNVRIFKILFPSDPPPTPAMPDTAAIKPPQPMTYGELKQVVSFLVRSRSI
jgi:hypothetical protein